MREREDVDGLRDGKRVSRRGIVRLQMLPDSEHNSPLETATHTHARTLPSFLLFPSLPLVCLRSETRARAERVGGTREQETEGREREQRRSRKGSEGLRATDAPLRPSLRLATRAQRTRSLSPRRHRSARCLSLSLSLSVSECMCRCRVHSHKHKPTQDTRVKGQMGSERRRGYGRRRRRCCCC